jgi:hypothetical protein
MSEHEGKPKQPTAPEVIANMPRRDTYSPEHGTGSPHLQPGELQDSEVWRSHKSSPATKEQNPAKQVNPKKKA